MLPSGYESVIETVAANQDTQFVVVEHAGNAVYLYDDRGEFMWTFYDGNADDAVVIVDEFRRKRVAARLKSTKLVHCPICESWHPSDFRGDCRDDGNRFPWPENIEDEQEFFDDELDDEDESDDEKEVEVQDPRGYIEERIKKLEDDVEFWTEKYNRRYLGEDGDHCLDQIKVKRAVIEELQGVINYIE